MIAAIIIAHFGGLMAGADAILPLYCIQLALALLVFSSIALLMKVSQSDSVEKTVKSVKRARGFIQDFRDLFKGERYLGRYLAMSAIRRIGMNTAMAFVPLWMVNVKGADQYVLGTITAVGMVTAMLLQVPVGRLSDRIGRKKTYFLLRPILYLGTLLLILAPRPEYLIIAGLLGAMGMAQGAGGGGIGGVSSTPFITMHWEMVPKEKISRWYGVTGILNFLNFPAALLGGFMWQQGLMIEVLLLPIVLEVLVMTPILFTVPDTLGRSTR